jgi:hypothetical protein
MRPVLAMFALVLLVAGCGGSGDESRTLTDGVYAYELTEQYLLDNGIPAQQAKAESGKHEATLDAGSFVDAWHTSSGDEGQCSGTFQPDGTLVTFRWTTGCFGDWQMRYEVEGDTVTWHDVQALPPHDSPDDQKINEVFNGVPWTRVGDAPDEG